MAIEVVRKYFKKYGREKDILEHEVSSATVELAAIALNVIPARIAKTLSFKNDNGCLLVVTAGDARIDNQKFKQEFGIKANMLSPEEVLSLTGHAVGGVCPFGIENKDVCSGIEVGRCLQGLALLIVTCGDKKVDTKQLAAYRSTWTAACGIMTSSTPQPEQPTRRCR